MLNMCQSVYYKWVKELLNPQVMLRVQRCCYCPAHIPTDLTNHYGAISPTVSAPLCLRALSGVQVLEKWHHSSHSSNPQAMPDGNPCITTSALLLLEREHWAVGSISAPRVPSVIEPQVPTGVINFLENISFPVSLPHSFTSIPLPPT